MGPACSKYAVIAGTEEILRSEQLAENLVQKILIIGLKGCLGASVGTVEVQVSYRGMCKPNHSAETISGNEHGQGVCAMFGWVLPHEGLALLIKTASWTASTCIQAPRRLTAASN